MDKGVRSRAATKRSKIPAAPPFLPTDRFSSRSRQLLSGAALRSFAAIAQRWQLSEVDRLRVLGFPGRSTYHQWLAKARERKPLVLPVDTLLRISAVLGIYKDLRILFAREEDENAWLRKPHDAPLFGGQPPVALLTNGTQDALLLVRRYLDAWRGGVFAAPNAADRDFKPYTDSDILLI